MSINCKELGLDYCYACKNIGSTIIQCDVWFLYNIMKSFNNIQNNSYAKQWFTNVVRGRLYSAKILIKVANEYYPNFAEEFQRIGVLL